MAEQRYERVELAGEARGEVMVYQPVTLTQISEGGFRLETSVPLLLDSLHEFRLTLGGRSVVAKGRIVHCRLVSLAGESVRYRAGVELTEPPAHVSAAIAEFIAEMKKTRS